MRKVRQETSSRAPGTANAGVRLQAVLVVPGAAGCESFRFVPVNQGARWMESRFTLEALEADAGVEFGSAANAEVDATARTIRNAVRRGSYGLL